MPRGVVVLLGALALLGAAAIAVRALGPSTQGFRVPSESMQPTIERGEEVTLNRDAYDGAAPQVGDIVILHPPAGAVEATCAGGPPPAGQMCARPTPERADVSFIDRVVAGPGEQVALERGRVIRDGRPADEPYARECEAEGCTFPRPITVPDDHYLVMGDNRGTSTDSRFWGPVPRAWIQGRVEDCDALRLSCSPIR